MHLNLKIKQSMLNTISILLFMFIFIVLCGSSYFMRLCLENEKQADAHRTNLQTLGQELANASDYLTEEARFFAITGDLRYLTNYWEEVSVTKRRNHAIDALKALIPPDSELVLLEKAKQHSDALISTEVHSMRLIVESYYDDLSLLDLPTSVANYILSPEEQQLDKNQKIQKAIYLLYDTNYIQSKEDIMNPISKFQDAMHARLNTQVLLAQEKSYYAALVQLFGMVLSLTSLGLLLYLFSNLLNVPIMAYSQSLEDFSLSNPDFKLTPQGTHELRLLGHNFNTLYHSLIVELKERQKAESIMKFAKEEAENAAQAKSQFLAHMSHEIRTPLNAILGYEQLLRNTHLDASQSRYMRYIQTATTTLLDLVNNILDFSKIESGKLKLENVCFETETLVHELYELFSLEAKQKGLFFNIHMPNACPKYLKSDVLRLKQILINLLSNAIKFTAHGEITLAISLNALSDTSATVSFEVSDTGIGMSSSQIQVIFDAFMQADSSTSRQYGGTGLGLSISKQLVELLGGHLKVESVLQKGTCFSFTLDFEIPKVISLVSDQTASVHRAVLSSNTKNVHLKSHPAFKNKQLLLVDDETTNLLLESEILSTLGFHVTTATSGLDALEKIQKMPCDNRFDIILMDLRMPLMDGVETTLQIRKLTAYQNIPIVAVTADAFYDKNFYHKNKENMIHTSSHIFDHILHKPIQLKDLMIVLSAIFTSENKPIAHNINRLTIHAERGVNSELTSPLSQLEMLLQNGDVLVINFFEHHSCYFTDLLGQPTYRRLQNYINAFDFEDALELITKLTLIQKGDTYV